MQIIIPMAGEGLRFKKVGYGQIKPLIEVHGKPMIEYIINLFPNEDDFLFLCNREHLKFTPLAATLVMYKPSGNIFNITPHNLGPVYSVLQADKFIYDDEPVILNYCDFNMRWDYERFKKTMAESNADGAIISYTGFHPHLYGPNFYAGVRVGEHNNVLEVKEKHSFASDKMQGWHSCGTYYFKSGKLLKKYFQKLIDKNLMHDNGEYYASLPYNLMIADGLKILNYPISHFCQWGTPEDLKQYEDWHKAITNGADANDFHLYQLAEQHPEIPLEGHRRALAYWKEFHKFEQPSLTYAL